MKKSERDRLDSISSDILIKIKNLRNQKGISQTKLAKSVGLSQTGYAKMESGATGNISLSVALGIAKALNVGFNELFDIDGDSRKIEKLEKEISELQDELRVKESLYRLTKSALISPFLTDSGNLIRYLEDQLKNDSASEAERNLIISITNSVKTTLKNRLKSMVRNDIISKEDLIEEAKALSLPGGLTEW